MDPTKTTETLLGLLSHLQTVESKFAHVLMESTLKMMTLTDANVFILIEAEDKRYYGGKSHLCEMFSRGHLQPFATDVEMEADVNSSSLTPKRVAVAIDSLWSISSPPSQPPQQQQQNQHLQSSFQTNGSKEIASPSCSSHQSKFGKRKMTRETTSPKRLKTEEEEPVTCEIKAEEPSEALPSKTIPSGTQCRKFDDAEFGAGVVDDYDDDDDNAIVLFDSSVASENDSMQMNDSYQTMVDLTFGDASTSSSNQDFPPNDVTRWLLEQLSSDATAMKKYEVARSLTNLEISLSDINSIERRLIASLFYSLGCHFIPKFCQEGDRSERDDVFRKVWTMMPNIHPLGTMKLSRPNGSVLSLFNHCKDAFLRPYRNVKNKKDREAKKKN